MQDLIARLEKAPGPARELDYRIAFAVGHPEGEPWERMQWCMPGSKKDKAVPAYTASLDAALTLVPEGWDWTLYSDGSGEIYRDVPPGMLPGAPGSTVIDFEAPTTALALCIAALRARASTASPSPPGSARYDTARQAGSGSVTCGWRAQARRRELRQAWIGPDR